MLQKRRLLKKEKSKNRVKLLLLTLPILIVVFLILEYFYLNFSLGRNVYLSPIAKDRQSQTENLEQKLDRANIKFSSVTASSDASFVVSLKDGGEVILSSKKDIGSQISSLQLILSRLTIEGKKINILDFRFDNPVVSF